MRGLYIGVLVFASVTGFGSGFFIESIVTTAFTNCTDIQNFLGVTYGQLNATNPPSASSIYLHLYQGSVWSKTIINLPNASYALLNNTAFNQSLPTEIIVHGYFLGSLSYEINALIDAFIQKGGRNVILLDANQIIGFWYMYSASAIRFIGNYLGIELVKLVNAGYDKSKIHLVGFSMGAHITGFAGKTFKSMTGGSLPWITGLDPAGPCFFRSDAPERLDSTDADFVDVIHSNMGVWGTTMQIGDIDFYPNGGSTQPGFLVLPRTSHILAIYFYVESILNTTSFISANCNTWNNFMAGACSWNARTNMGFAVNKGYTGRYYLHTSETAPYSKGDAGIPEFNFFAWMIGLFG